MSQVPAVPEDSGRPVASRVGGALTVVLGVAAASVALAGMRAASDIIGPMVLALVVIIIIHPAGNWLRQRMPTWAAVSLSVLLAYLIIGGLGFAIGLAMARFGTVLTDYQSQLAELGAQFAAWLQQLGVGGEQAQQLVSGFDASTLLPLVADVLSGLAGAAGSVFLVFALCFFMALDARAVVDSLREAGLVKPMLIGALAGFATTTRRYMLVATVFGFIIAACDTVVLMLLGIPEPLLWGLLAFMTNYIPNIGFLIGLVPPAVLALLESGPEQMVAVIVIYSVLNLGIQSGIQPKVVGNAVGLSSTLTFVSLVWAGIVGPVGALLAVPISLFVKAVLVDAVPANQWLVPVLAGRRKADSDGPGTISPGTDGPASDGPDSDRPASEGPGTEGSGTERAGTHGPDSGRPGTHAPTASGDTASG